MPTIHSGDFITLEGHSSTGAGTIGCPVFYVESARREVMALTNFHVLAAPLGVDAFKDPKALDGRAVEWAPRSGGPTGSFQRIGTVFAYDIPFNAKNTHPGGADRVDVAVVKLDPAVQFGSRGPVLDIFNPIDTLPRTIPLDLELLAAPEILFGDLNPHDWTNMPQIIGSSETLNLIEATFSKEEIPNLPMSTGEPSLAKGRLVVKLSGASGYSIGYIESTSHQFRAQGLALEMEFRSMHTAKTVRGKGQLESDSGSAVFDLLTDELYGLVSFHGSAFGSREPHRWVFTGVQDVKARFNHSVLSSFGHKGHLSFA